MGMDGISMANTGAIQEQTSADHASKVEQSIASDPTNMSQQVHGVSNNQRVHEKDESEENGGQKRKNNPQQEEFQDGYVEEPKQEEAETASDFDVEDFENPDKDFYVKLNIKDDIIELYDSSTDRLVETISGEELSELVQKLNMASGIFVNKKV